MHRGKLHLAGVLGLIAAMLVSLAMVATAAVGKNKPAAAQYQYGKVAVCHRTKSKKKPSHTIWISSRAVPAHLAHGDTLGTCASHQATAKGQSGKAKGKHGGKRPSQPGNGHAGGNGNGKGNGKNR